MSDTCLSCIGCDAWDCGMFSSTAGRCKSQEDVPVSSYASPDATAGPDSGHPKGIIAVSEMPFM